MKPFLKPLASSLSVCCTAFMFAACVEEVPKPDAGDENIPAQYDASNYTPVTSANQSLAGTWVLLQKMDDVDFAQSVQTDEDVGDSSIFFPEDYSVSASGYIKQLCLIVEDDDVTTTDLVEYSSGCFLNLSYNTATEEVVIVNANEDVDVELLTASLNAISATQVDETTGSESTLDMIRIADANLLEGIGGTMTMTADGFTSTSSPLLNLTTGEISMISRSPLNDFEDISILPFMMAISLQGQSLTSGVNSQSFLNLDLGEESAEDFEQSVQVVWTIQEGMNQMTDTEQVSAFEVMGDGELTNLDLADDTVSRTVNADTLTSYDSVITAIDETSGNAFTVEINVDLDN